MDKTTKFEDFLAKHDWFNIRENIGYKKGAKRLEALGSWGVGASLLFIMIGAYGTTAALDWAGKLTGNTIYMEIGFYGALGALVAMIIGEISKGLYFDYKEDKIKKEIIKGLTFEEIREFTQEASEKEMALFKGVKNSQIYANVNWAIDLTNTQKDKEDWLIWVMLNFINYYGERFNLNSCSNSNSEAAKNKDKGSSLGGGRPWPASVKEKEKVNKNVSPFRVRFPF